MCCCSVLLILLSLISSPVHVYAACPNRTQFVNPVVLRNASEVGLECTDTEVATLFVERNAPATLRCCFDGYTQLTWYKAFPGPTGPKDFQKIYNIPPNSSTFEINQVLYDRYFLCRATDAYNRSATFMQRLYILPDSMPPPSTPPKFDAKCASQKPFVVDKSVTIDCSLKVAADRSTAFTVETQLNNGPSIISCLVRPFCDRLWSPYNLTRHVCHHNSTSWRLVLTSHNQGVRWRLELSTNNLTRPRTVVKVTVKDANAPRNASGTVWTRELIQRLPNPLLTRTALSIIVLVSLLFLFIVLIIGKSFHRPLRLAVFRWRHCTAVTSSLGPCRVAVVMVNTEERLSARLVTQLASIKRCQLEQASAGACQSLVTAQTGADPEVVVVVVVSNAAFFDQAWVASVQALLLRDTTPRIFLLRQSFGSMAKGLEGEQLLLLRRLRVDARRWERVASRARPWWWVWKQVDLAIRLTHIKRSIVMPKKGHGTFPSLTENA